MNKVCVVIGALLIVTGLLWPWLIKSGLGRLPGDIVIQKKSMHFYFPLATSLVISAVVSLILWFLSKRS